jgi:BirA family biotin operon repressor/biotin-[acetyl-CoA-carboxylase] ligase
MNRGVSEVLQSLRDAGGEARSGEEISSALGVSRAQVWKHVGMLRSRGYEIEGAPGGGYRLCGSPDRLYAEEILCGLETRWLAREIHALETTESTNLVATDLARAGAAHGTTVVAEQQTAGRGRLGRSFYSPAHQNLYTSVVLRPELSTADAPTLLLAAGVAVAQTIGDLLDPGDAMEIKWPNDVLLGGLKTSGILMELNAEESRVSFAVLGIGVNLNVDPKDFPDEFRQRATSLSAYAGRPVDRVDFTRRLYVNLEEILDLHARGGMQAIRPRFDAWFRMVGRAVRVQEIGGAELSGIATGIAPGGALLIEKMSGEIVQVLAGDVTLTGAGDNLGSSAS